MLLLGVIATFIIITGSQARPIHSLQNRGLPLLHDPLARGLVARGEEVNPVKSKFKTIPDPGMGHPETNVLAENKTYTWDDDQWIMTETAFNPSMFYSRIPQANGQVNPISTIHNFNLL